MPTGVVVPGYTVRGLRVDPGLVLAPMSGVTTSAFRRLIKEFNPGHVGLVITEFISVEALTRNVPKSLAMMKFAPMERPFGIQIFGYDPGRMAEAARMAVDTGADLIDINCGCPAPKVVRKGGGCELMRQPDHVEVIYREVRKVVPGPLTAKMRSGWDAHSLNAPEIAKIAESEGLDAIAIHGRSRAQLYRGDADWSVVERVGQELRIPVLGSGDVVDGPTARSRLRYGVSGLMIGRGAMSNPLIFREIVTGERSTIRGDQKLALRIIRRYMELLLEDFTPQGCVGKVKQLVSQMCRGYAWRKAFVLAMTFEDQKAILQQLEDGEQLEEGRFTVGRPGASSERPAAGDDACLDAGEGESEMPYAAAG